MLPFQLLLPTMASLPLLMVYYVTYDRTDIVVPVILRPLLGNNVDLSLLVCACGCEEFSNFLTLSVCRDNY